MPVSLGTVSIAALYLGTTAITTAYLGAVQVFSGVAPVFSPSALFALAEPGVWYDPSDVANLDWRRNLILWSEQFDNSYWNKATGLTITTDAIAAPDGTMTADKLVETALNVSHGVIPPSAAVAFVAGQSYTVSAYFKAGERNWVNLQLPSAPFGSARRTWFNLATGVLGATASGATSVITPVGDGWYRCSLSALCTVTNAPATSAVWAICTADAVQVYLGDGVSGAYCWGAQLEVGTEPSAYQRITDLNTEIIALFPAATMYQDTNGIAPVTTPGQPVGLRLDKSKTLALGAELVANGDFSSGSTGWTTGGATTVISSGMATSTATPVGTNIIQQDALSPPANKLYQVKFDVTGWTAGSLRVFINSAAVTVTGGSKSYSLFLLNTDATPSGGFFIRAASSPFTGSIDNISVREVLGNHAYQATAGARLTYGVEPKTGTRNRLLATDAMATQSLTVTAVAHTLAFTGTGTVTLSGASTAGPLVGTGVADRVSLTFTPTAASLTLTVSGSVTLAQLELGSTATAYQRVTTAFDVTETGVASCHYCQYDGSDDNMVTTSIDFTSTDAMSVFAGVFKLTDAAIGTLMELSGSAQANAGAFFLRAPGSVAANYQYYGGGTSKALAESPATFPAPRYNLLTGYNDISADQMALRANGVQVAASTADQGTGNVGNHPLFIGRRAGTSLTFSGRDYGLIVVGKALTAGDLASTETWLAAKTPGVTL